MFSFHLCFYFQETENKMKLFVLLVIFSVAFATVIAELQDADDEYDDETADEEQLEGLYQQLFKRGLEKQDDEEQATEIDKRGPNKIRGDEYTFYC